MGGEVIADALVRGKSGIVFGDGLSFWTGDDSGDRDGDGVMVDSPGLQALATGKDKNITAISAFWKCLRISPISVA